ncbi:unnamed protein product [Nippostrongylus brasiliensis]|uniref:WD_REPEATS_REGION domain-containing protein n=1 Tax=Nippostrongylus brasiliensis TaxID=27835 RepID=A0A0N4XGG1_NIPBR|nr:unnamed protein product [Nippostrongylus brasiliensis]
MDIGSVVDSETDVRTNVSQYFAAHSATIMDLVGVPHRPDRLLSISGDTTVRLWDLERQESTLFYGHEMSVRSACFVPESSSKSPIIFFREVFWSVSLVFFLNVSIYRSLTVR